MELWIKKRSGAFCLMGPFEHSGEMKDYYQGLMDAYDKLVFCVQNLEQKPIRIVSLEEIRPGHSKVEIASVLYTKQNQ